jgi:hypothetical protein
LLIVGIKIGEIKDFLRSKEETMNVELKLILWLAFLRCIDLMKLIILLNMIIK